MWVIAFALALAQDDVGEVSSNQIDGVRLDLHGDFDRYGAFGLGVRAEFPLFRYGFADGVKDEIALSPGIEYFFVNTLPDVYDGSPYLIPVAGLQWNFYLGKRWSVFPELGAAFFVGDAASSPRGKSVYALADLAFGVRFHLSDRDALFVRAGTPAGLQLGLTF